MTTGLVDDIDAIRARAREDVLEGAVTADYTADRARIIEMLNAALATELVCFLRYKRHASLSRGLRAQIASSEFEEHAMQELDHAGRLATRIVQLNGSPDFNPQGLADRSHAEYRTGDSLDDMLREMLREDLIAERVAIDVYRNMIRTVGDQDPTTRGLLEDILAQEEEHASDLAVLIDSIG